MQVFYGLSFTIWKLKGTGGDVFWVTSLTIQFLQRPILLCPKWVGFHVEKAKQENIASRSWQSVLTKQNGKSAFPRSQQWLWGAAIILCSLLMVWWTWLTDFLGLWYFHAPLPDDKITSSFFKMLWTYLLLICWSIYIPTCQAALAWYCLAPLKCYFLRTASEGNSYFCPVLPVTGLCCVASATFPLGQMDNISDAQYDCVHLVRKAIANSNPKDEWKTVVWLRVFAYFNTLIYFIIYLFIKQSF